MKCSELPVYSPESAGIPSKAVEAYLDSLTRRKFVQHSLLIMRHDRIVFEAYWKPFSADFRHRLYSCSKSFVSCAVGLLIEQGKLHLSDKAVSFFPDKAPKDVHPYLAMMTIRDLLMMATCYETGASYKPADPDWEATFFTAKVDHVPGTVFSYCTTATTMLCMIVKRVTGKEFTEVLRPVFDELGISEDLYCVESPCGHEWGGSGVMATTREFAAFANLCMHYGKHNGKQLLPEAYLREATAKQIDNSLYQGHDDDGLGYGYQFWCGRNGSFAFYGMGGQYAVCLPEQDLLVITTGYEELKGASRHSLFDGVYDLLVPALSDAPLPEDKETAERLAKKAAALTLVMPDGETSSPVSALVSGKKYIMDKDNKMGLKWVRFDFEDGKGVWNWENATGVHALPFTFGETCETAFPETHYNGRRIGTPANRELTAFTSAAWMLPQSLMIFCHISDISFGQFRVNVVFKDNYVTIHSQKHAEFFLEEYGGFVSGKAE